MTAQLLKSDELALKPVERPLTLIPVGLKEGALDSPSFRASIVHFADQVELVEAWLERLCKSATKLAQATASVEALIQPFLASSEPPDTLSEAILDHDYTLQALKRFNEGAQDFWTHTVGSMRRTQDLVIDPIQAFLSEEVRPFKEVRRHLESAQKAYDNALARYASQSKAKEASSLREDAFQLFESRKAYLKVSMDYCVLGPQLRLELDRVLVKVFSGQWSEMKGLREGSSNAFARSSIEMDRIYSWSYEMSKGEKALKRELLVARRQIEERALDTVRPSRDLDTYSASTVAFLGSSSAVSKQAKASDSSAISKQGWLFLRILSGKPSRTQWVRRWFFVKNGIFGWLMQSVRSIGVEESEKVGVLLCGVRPAVQEERRFCFELKTKDTTMILQAETQSELTEWLTVFELAKKKAIEEPEGPEGLSGSGNPASDAAFAVSPPVSTELAAKREDGQMVNIAEDVPEITLTLESDGFMSPTRSNVDVNAARKSFSGRENEGTRDHAARLIQNLSKKVNPASPVVTVQSPTGPLSGISSLLNVTQDGPMTSTRNRSSSRSSVHAPNTLVSPPTQTNLSSATIAIGVERGLDLGVVDATGGVPSGLMANQWGSTNYGHLSRVERGEIAKDSNKSAPPQRSPSQRRTSDPQPATEAPANVSVPTLLLEPTAGESAPPSPPLTPTHRKTVSTKEGVPLRSRSNSLGSKYPDYYPNALKPHDVQMRMLFPNVHMDERLVMAFRASWNPNDQHELPGRAFVTNKEIYYYSIHFGMVLVSGITLDSIAEVSAKPGKAFDHIYLHLHGRDGPEDSDVIALKIFLEPLQQLQRKLSYLVKNANSKSSAGIEAILQALDSQMDSSQNGLQESAGSYLYSSRKYADRMTEVRVDKSIHVGSFSDDPSKFKLPSHPVNYAPEDMNELAAEKSFDVSAKALFHLIFGDKSAICQMLYQERRASSVTQYPWIKPETDDHYIRRFEYTIGPDNAPTMTPLLVGDIQVIDVANEHLCYVVTDAKIPWHLPRPDDFRLISKIVITHEAKSRSKIAIYTKIKWTRIPWFSKSLIERQALEDLRLDAMNTISLVAEQVERLGTDANTKRVVQIFGNVGQQTEASQVLSTDPALLKRPLHTTTRKTTLFGLYWEALGSFVASAISTILLTFGGIGRALWRVMEANKLLMLLTVLSVALNIFGASNSMTIWWRDRSAARFMSKLGVHANHDMSKSIWLADIDALVAPLVISPRASVSNSTENDEHPLTGSKCYNAFERVLSYTGPETSPRTLSSVFSDHATRTIAHRLHRSRRRTSTQRHNMLVALRLTNTVERDAILAEYENWLYEESMRCEQMGTLLNEAGIENVPDGAEVQFVGAPEDATDMLAYYKEYCESCKAEYNNPKFSQ